MSGPEPAARASLAAVIQHDIEAVRRLEPLLEQLPPDAAYPACAAVAYALHNLYNALENSFDQISRTFENHVVDPDRWHRELMLKMFIEIPGLRPGVLAETARPLLDDLRSFRHVFRHGYDFQLDAVKLNRLVESWQAERSVVLDGLSRFEKWLLAEE
jgi:HepT-like protein